MAMLATFGWLSLHISQASLDDLLRQLTDRTCAGVLSAPHLTSRKGQRTPGSGAGLLGLNPDLVTSRLCDLCFNSLCLFVLHLSNQDPTR